METIEIEDVKSTYIPDLKAFEITINKDTMLDKETGDLLIEEFFCGLGDIITCNEINPSNDYWFAYDGEIYTLDDDDFQELKETGKTIMSYYGTLKDNIELDVKSDVDFAKWYYEVETIKQLKGRLKNE